MLICMKLKHQNLNTSGLNLGLNIRGNELDVVQKLHTYESMLTVALVGRNIPKQFLQGFKSFFKITVPKDS